MKRHWVIASMLITLVASSMGAQPESTSAFEPTNVLVGDLTFTRPEKWRWQPAPTNTVAQTSYIVPDAGGEISSPVVLFFLSPKNSAEAIEAWKPRFPDPTNTREVQPGEVTINNRSVTYYGMSGIYVFKRHRLNNHTLFGVVIPAAGKFVHILLIGPATNVREAIPELKRMVENAVAEAE